MEAAFSWLGQIFEAILRFIPRIVIVRATHGGVKWRYGKRVIPLAPGLHVYWPLVTEIEIIVTARQPLSPPKQILTTRDDKRVTVGVVVVYRIRDVEQAIGRINWEVDVTVNDISQAAVVSVIMKHTYQEVLDMIVLDELNNRLVKAVQKNLHPFGVSVSQCKITDFAYCQVLKLVTDTPIQKVVEPE